MNNETTQEQQHIEALEAELNHYIKLCQSQKDLLRQYIQLQKRALRQLQSLHESKPQSTNLGYSPNNFDEDEARANNG